jgi:hypothetical protein
VNPTYKVIELSNVTDDDLESTLNEWVAKGWTFEGVHFAMRESSKRPNEWVAKGWTFEGVHFAMRESSKRPSMAFVTFTREADAEES